MAVDLLTTARAVSGIPAWPNVLSIAVGLVLLVILYRARARPTSWLGTTIFLANALVIIVALWFANDAYAQTGRFWVPFQANKIATFTVALLASEEWVGVLAIVGFAGTAVVQRMTFGPQVLVHMAVGEPGITLITAVFGLALLVFRLRRAALAARVARAAEEAIALQRLSQVLLDVRDLSNTPLQTIAFSAALIRKEHPELQPVLGHIDQALQKLKELDAALKVFEGHAVWPPGTVRPAS